MTNKIYIVVVNSKIGFETATVSSEGYKTLEEAKTFIINRSDRPELYRD